VGIGESSPIKQAWDRGRPRAPLDVHERHFRADGQVDRVVLRRYLAPFILWPFSQGWVRVLLAQQSPTLEPVAPWLFYLFAGVAVLGALGVVFSQQIVRMAVFLLFTLGGVAFLYFFLEAEFLAAIQLIVYVGGTLILIIFGVMLTSKNPFVRLTVPVGQRLLGWGIGLALTLMMLFIGVLELAGGAPGALPTEGGGEHYGIADLGRNLLGKYALPLELAGVLLLVVMIGAAYIAKGRQADLAEGEGHS